MTAKIKKVKKYSKADLAGIRAGDVIEEINKTKPRDVIDYQISCSDEDLLIKIRRGSGHHAVRLPANDREPMGITFSDSIFDRVKTCVNNCRFCFIDQLPKGLRKSLYVKDDDFRLSFLYGNFITLTNLGENDIDRILNQRLSPLYVSLHSIDPDVRGSLIRPRKHDRAVDYLKKLIGGGIETHIQIVLCPGFNDGDDLTTTLKWLTGIGAASVGIVPVGLTGHRDGLDEPGAVDKAGAERAIELITGVQIGNLKLYGRRIVFLADEFYLLTGAPLPPYEHYEDFFQLENGIGIARRFIDDSLREMSRKMPRLINRKRFTLVTTELAVVPVTRVADAFSQKWGLDVDVVTAKNRFLGGGVSVSGLLAGADVIDTFENIDKNSTVLVPDICLNADDLFLDNFNKESVKESAPFELEFVSSRGDAFIRKLYGMAS